MCCLLRQIELYIRCYYQLVSGVFYRNYLVLKATSMNKVDFFRICYCGSDSTTIGYLIPISSCNILCSDNTTYCGGLISYYYSYSSLYMIKCIL